MGPAAFFPAAVFCRAAIVTAAPLTKMEAGTRGNSGYPVRPLSEKTRPIFLADKKSGETANTNW